MFFGDLLRGLLKTLGYLIFLLFLCLPISNNILKGALITLFLVLAAIAALCGSGRLGLSRPVTAWALWYLSLGAFFIFLGVLRDTSGALFASMIYFGWPLVYLVFVACIRDEKLCDTLFRLMIIATIWIGFATLNHLAWVLGYVPDHLHLDLAGEQTIVFSAQGYARMRLYAISSLIFLIPFLVASLLISGVKKPPAIAKPPWLMLALFMGIGVSLLAGRKALLLVMLLALPSTILFAILLPQKQRREAKTSLWYGGVAMVVALSIVALYLVTFSEVSLKGTVDYVASGFDFDTDPEALERKNQFISLIRGWQSSPLLGQGLGAQTEFVRSEERPWEYELQYALLLFNTGLLGFIAYSTGIVWIYMQAISLIRRGDYYAIRIIPLMVGMTSFLIANATNPYLQAYGHLWTIFLPIAIINRALLTEGRGLTSSTSPARV